MTKKTTPKTLADFKAEYDPDVKVPKKIKDGFASLLAEGKESWEYEGDFIRRCGLSVTQFAAFRESFMSHSVSVRPEGRSTEKRVWFADPKVAAKAKGG